MLEIKLNRIFIELAIAKVQGKIEAFEFCVQFGYERDHETWFKELFKCEKQIERLEKWLKNAKSNRN